MALPSALGKSTSRQLRALTPASIIPVGSTEQHGAHLPHDTGARIATAVARAVAERLGGDWLLAPFIGYGASGGHGGFPGTASIGPSRVVFVNGHGGNVDAVAQAVTLLREEGRDVAWVPCAASGAGAHRERAETSVLLHIWPNYVRMADVAPQLRHGSVTTVGAWGVLGDPASATVGEGARIFAEMVRACIRRIAAWAPAPGGMLA